jgi:hypothetical protein
MSGRPARTAAALAAIKGPKLSVNRPALVQDCRYPNGTRVLCLAVLDLKDGLITRQSGVQPWDE